MYKSVIKPILFRMDPERVHHLVFNGLKLFCSVPGASLLLKSVYGVNNNTLAKTVMGIRFTNPVGLAAGFDKNAALYNELGCLGFGFIEIGTVTPLPQPGNDKPRLFRLPLYQALINRMGFNNEGVKSARKNLQRKRKVIIGGNIGKNKITANENAISDYITCFESLFDVVDYFVVNVSSPNTPGLRELQEKEPLLKLLNSLQEINKQKAKPKPVLLKIAPDMEMEMLDTILDIVSDSNLNGIVISNTTISREGIDVKSENAGEQGGLSGLPLKKRSTEMIRYARQKGGENLVIIGVGGIFTGVDAAEKLAAGADLVQVYTGFIYEGPAMVRKICRHLSQ